MYCITKYKMKFNDIVIPARTRGKVINKLSTDTVKAPGIAISVFFPNERINKDCISNEIEVIKHRTNCNSACLSGIVIDTNLTTVCMDANHKLYRDTGLYIWELEEIFGKDNVPENLFLGKHKYFGKDAKLRDVIDYLEEEFSMWVRENCGFKILSEDDIENGEGFYGAEPGDSVLSDEGYELFSRKQLEYQTRLETVGFTYDFKGGLTF